jgi:hypothetical protein
VNCAVAVARPLILANAGRQTGHNCLTLYHRVRVGQREGAPGVVDLCTGDLYIPQQKIFAKVKADLASDLRLYLL